MKIDYDVKINPKSDKSDWAVDIDYTRIYKFKEKGDRHSPIILVDKDNNNEMANSTGEWHMSEEFFKEHFIPVKIKNWEAEFNG